MNRHRRVRRYALVFLGVLILGTLVYALRTPILTGLGAFLVAEEPPVHADAVVTLGGDDFGMRVIKAAQLVQQGYAPYVLVSGPEILWGYECDLLIDYAVRRGYPKTIFRTFGHSADSTKSEAKLIAAEARKRGIHKMILVTSNFHTHRAGYLMRKLAPDLEIHVVAAPDKYFTPDGWWKTRGGKKEFFLEWAKTVSTWLGN